MNGFLQFFLIFNALIIGVIATLAVQHAIAHKNQKKEAKKPEPDGAPKLPASTRQALLEAAEARFLKEIEQSAKQLQTDLQKTVSELSAHTSKIGGEIISVEMKRYRDSLESLRTQTDTVITTATAGVTKHQSDITQQLDEKRAELEASMHEDIAKEKQLLLEQMNTKLSDAITSFLVETLQHDIDLGAQSDYLIATLEEHKQELIKDATSEL